MIVQKVIYGDAEDGGGYKIVGRTENVVGPRLLRLYERKLGRHIQSHWSDANEDYAFLYLKMNDYFIVGFDHFGQFNVGGADHCVLEPI